MVQVVLNMTTVPRQTSETIRAFRSLKLSIQSARGLIGSHVFLDAEAPNSLCYIEEWRGPEAFSQDVVAEHFTRLFGLMEKSADAPVLRVNTVASTQGIEHLSALMQASHRDDVGREGVRDAS